MNFGTTTLNFATEGRGKAVGHGGQLGRIEPLGAHLEFRDHPAAHPAVRGFHRIEVIAAAEVESMGARLGVESPVAALSPNGGHQPADAFRRCYRFQSYSSAGEKGTGMPTAAAGCVKPRRAGAGQKSQAGV